MSITLAYVGAQSTRRHVPIATSDTDEARLLTVSTTAQSLDAVGFPLSPTAPLQYKRDSSRE